MVRHTALDVFGMFQKNYISNLEKKIGRFANKGERVSL